ncbi:MAG: DNA polymerase III subunit gamma/tau [Firmicutes bacterium]|nr:DNA polymerase III subunit gamma/tau [Bacillota bacterium]
MNSLYRKYRPSTFDEVIGQNHITTTLVNQIKSGKIRHAYLFTGSRGTGKTTSARIFASAVNCIEPKNGSPCYKCSVCSLLKANVHADILEIDAASNNKVDEVRALRDTINFAPVSSKYKVYIIDEVHMLTDSAFNALLKTLEEPPSHVIFILGTTEVHKLPATILSRCMRFDFHLVSRDNLKMHLAGILKKENKEFEDDAIDYIASLAEGSVRDSISLLDTCINFSDGILTTQAVLEVLGAVDRKKIFELFEMIAEGDVGNALKITHELEFEGKSMSYLAKELVYHARDLLVTKTLGTTLVKGTKEHLDYFKEKAKSYEKGLLVELIGIFSSIDADLRYAVNPKIVLQAAIIKSTHNPQRIIHNDGKVAGAVTNRPHNISEQNAGVNNVNPIEKTEKKKIVEKIEKIAGTNDPIRPPTIDEDFGLEPPPVENEIIVGAVAYHPPVDNERTTHAPTDKTLDSKNNSGRQDAAPTDKVETKSKTTKQQKESPSIPISNLPSSPSSLHSPTDIWGKLTTYFRRANDMQAYNIVLGKGKNAEIENDELVLKTQDEDFMVLSDPSVHHKINDTLKVLNFPFRLRVEKTKLDTIDMDKEIRKLKEMTEGVKLKISYK